MGFGVLGLMIFIDHANGLRQAFGTQEENMHTDFLHQNQSNVHIDPQLLCSWVVMNTINGVARGGSPCALVLPSLAPEG